MEHLEPRSLAVVRTLARDLECQPLVLVVLLWARAVGDLVILVVGVDEVLDDGSRFPEADASVGVFDGGDTALRKA